MLATVPCPAWAVRGNTSTLPRVYPCIFLLWALLSLFPQNSCSTSKEQLHTWYAMAVLTHLISASCPKIPPMSVCTVTYLISVRMGIFTKCHPKINGREVKVLEILAKF